MKKFGRYLCALLIAALLFAALPAAAAEGGDFACDFSVEDLGGALERYLAERRLKTYRITIGWRDLTSGEEYYFGPDVFREGASTYKLPLCMLYADRVAEGAVSREDTLGVYTVDRAVSEALINSSNSAADALRYGVSLDQRTYRTAIAANCGIPLEELPGGYYTANQFSPRYLIGTLQALWDGKDGKYDWIVDYMKLAQPEEYISRFRGELEVAHKTGNALGYVCDTGIVFAARPFLLTVMTYGLGDAESVIAEIARLAMDYAEYLAAQDGPAPEPEPTAAPVIKASPAPAAAEEPALAPRGADGVREIATAAQLRGIALEPEGEYRLAADIDLSGEDWTPIPFSGTLDGAGHTIYNLTLRSVGGEAAECRDGNNKPYTAHYAGLFSVARFATVRDLTLRGVYAALESEDSCFVAALAGYAYDLTAEHVSVEGRLRLYAHGKIVGVGGMVGFGSGWFSDCASDVELVFEDRNEGLHCEMFLGGLVASGKFTAERCRVDIRGFGSVNGFVHTGGMVGMYCGYGLVRERMMRVADCTVTGKISFFENNFTRRAYCRGFAGEQVDLVINERNDISGFVRDERFRYDEILSPEGCAAPRYTESVTAPGCESWGYTAHVCEGCGYGWIDSYTPPRHTPGAWETLREPESGASGEAVLRCAVCGAELERKPLPASEEERAAAPETLTLDAQALYMKRGAAETLHAAVLPREAEPTLVWTSSDETVAAVSEDGTVTAIGRGEATISCTTEDGALSAQCLVTVRDTFWQRLAALFGG